MAKRTKYEYQSTENYDYDIRPGETDLQYYRRLAKTADQRLVRLEALKHDKHFRGVEKYAYARAMRDIEKWGGKKRFNTKPPEARSLFNEKISDMLRFLQSPTSTKSGVIEVYQKRAESLNDKYKKEGMNLSWQDMANVLQSGGFEQLKGDKGSDTAFKSIGTVSRNIDQIKKVIEESKAKRMEELPEDEDEKQRTLAEMLGLSTGTPLDEGIEQVLHNSDLMAQFGINVSDLEELLEED